MEREIKFRGKSKNTGDWLYGVPVKSVNDNMYLIHSATEDAINTRNEVDFIYSEVYPKTVGQLVKEYNSARYFEGDIGRTKDEGKLIIILTWIDQHSLFGWLTTEEYEQNKSGNLDFDTILFWTYAFSDDSAKDIEVIGNIHDNPELV